MVTKDGVKVTPLTATPSYTRLRVSNVQNALLSTSMIFPALFHLVSTSGLYLGVNKEDMVVGVARTCRNQESLLWHWEGSHLVSQQGSTVAVKRIKDGYTNCHTIFNDLCSHVSRSPNSG